MLTPGQLCGIARLIKESTETTLEVSRDANFKSYEKFSTKSIVKIVKKLCYENV